MALLQYQLTDLKVNVCMCMSECVLLPDLSLLAVVIEATKVLCNIVLNHRHLSPLMADLGCLTNLSSRLSNGLASQLPPSHNRLFFDLRLLFLITACGPSERWV